MIAKPNYLDSFFRNRVVPLYLNFLLAFFCYLIITAMFIGGVKAVDVLKGMFFLHAFGNPTWFLFCTMAAYLVVWTAFKFLENRAAIPIACFAGMILYVLIIIRFKPSWWYDTALVFPFGVTMAIYKDKVINMLSCHYLLCFFVAVILFVAIFKVHMPFAAWIKPSVLGVLLMAIIMLFTMRLKVASRPLEWCGKHVFPIYMYHMLFFLLAKVFVVNSPGGVGGGHLLVVTTFVLTLIISHFYRFWRVDAPKVKRIL